MRQSLILAGAALALATQAASAQGSCNDLKRYFTKPPTLGEWADIQMEGAGRQKTPTVMRFGFVGREERKGQQYYRMQMTMTGRDGQPHIMQMLTPWGPDALTQEAETELVMKMGDRPAMIMPMQGGNDQADLADLRKKCAETEFVGEETIEVPAGQYQTRHYTGPDGDSWLSMDVPGFRLVKMVTRKGRTMVLMGTGSGLENQITETPVDMKAMMGRGMRGMPQRGEQEQEAK